MEHSTYFLTFLLLFVVINVVKGQPLVPALFIFGDSVVDAGNNNNLYTIVKSNFPPYGRDFNNQMPTGRFCNGKLAADFTAENLGFTTYPPAYLNLQEKGKNLLNGANFASGASGYFDPPLGCLPAAITLFGSHSNECVDRLNNDALNFNTKLNTTSQNLQKGLSNLTLAVLDIYQPLHDLVTKPLIMEDANQLLNTSMNKSLIISLLCNLNTSFLTL